MHPRTRFQAGSISKQVMAVVVLELTRRQELQLDQPITRWLAHIPAHWQAVTLHQLLSHTSGLGHWGDVPGLPPVLEVPPGRNELVDLIARRLWSIRRVLGGATAAPASWWPGWWWRR